MQVLIARGPSVFGRETVLRWGAGFGTGEVCRTVVVDVEGVVACGAGESNAKAFLCERRRNGTAVERIEVDQPGQAVVLWGRLDGLEPMGRKSPASTSSPVYTGVGIGTP